MADHNGADHDRGHGIENLIPSHPLTPPLQKGEGWRLGWNPQMKDFPGLVGAEEWAIELTLAELWDFCRLSQRLAETLREMDSQLMAEERIACEVESDRLWLEAEGFPQSYELRLMLLTGRRSEGTWSPRAVPPLMQAVQTLTPQLPDPSSL